LPLIRRKLSIKDGGKITKTLSEDGSIRDQDIPIVKEEIIGRITLKDIVDLQTGEVLLEAMKSFRKRSSIKSFP